MTPKDPTRTMREVGRRRLDGAVQADPTRTMREVGRRLAGLLFLAIFLLFDAADPCVASLAADSHQAIASKGVDNRFILKAASDGIVLEFPIALALDRLQIPVHDRRLWGAGNAGKVVVLRWPGGSGIGTRNESEAMITVEVGGVECHSVEILPIRIESASETTDTAAGDPGFRVVGSGGDQLKSTDARESWVLEAVPVFQRRVEFRLERFADLIHRRQRSQGCFSCHLLLPLFSTVAIARERGYRIPDADLASITADLVSWQHVDGSFDWPDHPEYGSITPTAVAAASLAVLRGSNPAADEALQRAGRFLIGRQREDGSLRPDFTFPGFVSGPEFTTRALLETLSAGAAVLARLGRYEPPGCAEARRRASGWLDRIACETGPARELAWLALPLAGRFPEASRSANLETLTVSLKNTDFQREPARAAWFTRQLILLGGSPPEELEASLSSFSSPVKSGEALDARDLWRLMAAIWFQFHRETNVGICR